MKVSTSNTLPSLGRDYLFFSAIIIALMIVFCAIASFSIFSLQEKRRQEKVNTQLSIVSHELKKSLGNVENFLQFIGDKFVNSSNENMQLYATFFKHSVVLDSNFQNIYLSTFMNWVNKNNKMIITANSGLLENPIEVPKYYPLKESMTRPWTLIPYKIQLDKKGYFIPTSMSIFDDNGIYRGSIVADLIIDSIQRELNLSIVNKDVAYVVIDKDNNILMTSLGKNIIIPGSVLEISDHSLSDAHKYNKVTEPIRYKDIIFSAYKQTSLGLVILTGYSNIDKQNEFKQGIKPYISLSVILTLIFLGISYLFRNVKILPVISILKNRLHSETEAREANERILSRILSNTPGFVYRHRVFQDKLTVEYISDGCFDLTGYKPEQYLSAINPINYGEVIDPEYLGTVIRTIKKAIRNQKPYEVSYPIRTVDGKKKWVLNQGNALSTDKGDIGKGSLIEGMLTDITYLKEAEQKMSKMLHDLELSNTELERFAYVCSHDLKEPLRTIFSYIQLIRKDKNYNLLSDKSTQYIEIVEGASLRMKDLIENILLYSKVGTQPVVLDILDINEVIFDVKKSLSALIEETSAQIIVKQKFPVIMGDVGQFRRLFQNLLSNSLKFHRRGVSPIIVIDSQVKDKEIIFSIKDNGIGVEKQYYDIIFNLFSRLNSQDHFPGTGIGLAICKRIVERHGGNIWIKSKSGQETIIYFTLPQQ